MVVIRLIVQSSEWEGRRHGGTARSLTLDSANDIGVSALSSFLKLVVTQRGSVEK